jgi:predicted dehydrogenase
VLKIVPPETPDHVEDHLPRPIRVGIAGASLERGWGGRAHVPALMRLDEYEIVAVAATSALSAHETAAAVGIPLAFGSTDEMARHPAVDLVVAAARVPSHAGVVRAAIDAGKSVLSEWPLAISLAEATDLVETAVASGVVHAIGLQGLHAPGTARVRNQISGGRIGKVWAVRAFVSADQSGGRVSQSKRWLADANSGANLLTITGGHLLSVLTEITGDALQWVSAFVDDSVGYTTVIETGEAIPGAQPRNIAIAGSFRQGALLSASLTSAPPGQATFWVEIAGTEGVIRITPAKTGSAEGSINVGEWRVRVMDGRGRQEELAEPIRSDPSPARSSPPLVSRNVGMLYRKIAPTVFWGGSASPSFETALYYHQLIDAIERSSETGTRQMVPAAPVMTHDV